MNGTFPNSAPAGLPDAGMHVGTHLPMLGRARGSAGVGLVLAPGMWPHPIQHRREPLLGDGAFWADGQTPALVGSSGVPRGGDEAGRRGRG